MGVDDSEILEKVIPLLDDQNVAIRDQAIQLLQDRVTSNNKIILEQLGRKRTAVAAQVLVNLSDASPKPGVLQWAISRAAPPTRKSNGYGSSSRTGTE